MDIRDLTTLELLQDLRDYAAGIAICDVYITTGLLADIGGKTPAEYKKESERMSGIIVSEILRRCGDNND